MNFFSCLFPNNSISPNPTTNQWNVTKPLRLKDDEMEAIFLFTKHNGNGLSPDYALASVFVNSKVEIKTRDNKPINKNPINILALITYSKYHFAKLNYLTLINETGIRPKKCSEKHIGYIEIDVVVSTKGGGHALDRIQSLKKTSTVFLKSVPTAYSYYISKLNFHRFYITNDHVCLLPNCFEEETNPPTKCTLSKREDIQNYGVNATDNYTPYALNELGGLIPLIYLMPNSGGGHNKIQSLYDKYCR